MHGASAGGGCCGARMIPNARCRRSHSSSLPVLKKIGGRIHTLFCGLQCQARNSTEIKYKQ
eukprot:5936797-Pleurochrysis_carterae.AAC.1